MLGSVPVWTLLLHLGNLIFGGGAFNAFSRRRRQKAKAVRPGRDHRTRRSRDEVDLDSSMDDEDDVWHRKDKLFKDHIQEVLTKWNHIDDEIWAKIVVMERNRRVAKAYARAPVLTINGSEEGFDGLRIGLCGFDNPMRDSKTEIVKRQIGQGLKVKMDDYGNILLKRLSKSSIFVSSTCSESCVGPEVQRLHNGCLPAGKPVRLFDMKRFQENVISELKRTYPDRRKLEQQCISTAVFGKNDQDILRCPCWIMIINVVAIDMLKSRLPSAKRLLECVHRPPGSNFSDGSGSRGSTGRRSSGGSSKDRDSGWWSSENPPKLPPRDTDRCIIPKVRALIGLHDRGVLQPDYDDDEMQEEGEAKEGDKEDRRRAGFDEDDDDDDFEAMAVARFRRGQGFFGGKTRKCDDPYYCGMKARIPEFCRHVGSDPDHAHGGGGIRCNPSGPLVKAERPSIVVAAGERRRERTVGPRDCGCEGRLGEGATKELQARAPRMCRVQQADSRYRMGELLEQVSCALFVSQGTFTSRKACSRTGTFDDDGM